MENHDFRSISELVPGIHVSGLGGERMTNKTLGLRMRMWINTHVPIPVTLRGRRVNIGSRVFEADAQPWMNEAVNKVEWYTEIDALAVELLAEVRRVSSPDQDVLDICCNVGRHLNHLSEHGYQSLTGFDIMRPAIDQAKTVFPALAGARLHLARADEFLSCLPTGSIDWAYTHTATVELIHPWFRIHSELFRAIRPGGGVVFLLNETGHSYPRHWRFLFRQSGFIEERYRQLTTSKGYQVALITWRRPG